MRANRVNISGVTEETALVTAEVEEEAAKRSLRLATGN